MLPDLVPPSSVENEKLLQAVILHDTIDDTKTRAQELAERFGNVVVAVVLEVIDGKSLSKAERKRLQIKHAATICRRAKLVKLADKIANLRDIAMTPSADWSIRRQRDYFEWAMVCAGRIRPWRYFLKRRIGSAPRQGSLREFPL